jgi:hypothetical protein
MVVALGTLIGGTSCAQSCQRGDRRAPLARAGSFGCLVRVGTLIAVAALAVGGCGGSGDEDAVREAVDGYVAALRAADPNAVCALLTEAKLADLELSGSCAEVYGRGFELLAEQGVEVPSYEIAEVEVDEDTAEATLVSGSTEEVVPLAMEGGEWKLTGATAFGDFHPDDPIPGG